jgi:hypothetical protein
MGAILFPRKEAIINIWPNRDDGDRVLIVVIDENLGDAQTIRTSFFSSFKNVKVLDLWLHCYCHVNQNPKLSGLTNSFVG